MEYRKDITAGYLRGILDYDELTGLFTWRYRTDREVNWNSRWAGKVAGHCNVLGYTVLKFDHLSPHFAHRLAWLYVYGEWPPDQLDHINGDRSDNRISNLRLANNTDNGHNRGPQRNNKSSGLRGVYPHTQNNSWVARVKYKGKSYSIGSFRTAEEAVIARDVFVQKLIGDFATLAASQTTRYTKPTRDPTRGPGRPQVEHPKRSRR